VSAAAAGRFDAIVIGSGFGGAGVAHELVAAGLRVLMLERGDRVARGPENWRPESAGMLTPHYSRETLIQTHTDRGVKEQGGYYLVGGPSVYYGGVSLRFREADFTPSPGLLAGSGGVWPIRYDDLEPWYSRAETLIGVAGVAGDDPTEPRRSQPFPQAPGRLAQVSERIAAAARELGLRPFRLPLAINYSSNGRAACCACTTCDGFACAISAKNDLATTVLPRLEAQGLALMSGVVVRKLLAEGGRVVAVEGVDRRTGALHRWAAERVVLSAGALASPHLLLASGLARFNPAGDQIGRYLQRHRNAITFGFFRSPPDPVGEHHKQIGIHDYYFGDPAGGGPEGKLGSLQQLPTPPVELVRANVPRVVGALAGPMVGRLTGLLAMAEDQPQAANRVEADSSRTDRFGLPALVVHHRYSPRDVAAERVLSRVARRILRRAGAVLFYRHAIDTFSHAAGTVRMGDNPTSAPLDPSCRFRGLDNLWVVDASFMPTSAAVNPSLTIFANALRVGRTIAEQG
jgi:choline dehydrogenase-like flavoprotein